ncbi:MAG: SAM-dependent methyltransferase [Flavobacteriaceae bacterium]|nr:MAG: SAM-dependent methyltransferase [Flavobacteriaceae bacterium]
MKRKIITTNDGSKTIHIEEWNEQYHSIHGAIQEAQHVFIKNGLDHFLSKTKNKAISILEIGFGTGLNAFLTYLQSEKIATQFNYVGVEAYPILLDELDQLNYAELISKNQKHLFLKLHTIPWGEETIISSNFSLLKRKQHFQDISDMAAFDLIYFDAFGARVQPDLWTESIFNIMSNALRKDGVLVTYSAKGSARRAMESVGLTTEILAGPPGKRHMLRATKKS